VTVATAVPDRTSAQPAAQPRKGKEPRGFRSFEFAMMLPALVLLAILSIIPFLMLIAMSFSQVRTSAASG